MDDPTRLATKEDLIREKQRLGLSNQQLAHVLGRSRGPTISRWLNGHVAPTITYEELMRRLEERYPSRPTLVFSQRDRDYTTAIIALIKSDAEDIAASARRQLDKLDVAERFLSGKVSPAPVSLAVETEESQALRPDAEAHQGKSQRRRGHR